jgi:tRNA threonylcarbamoyladenosine biosynthesis protein TsaE
VNPPRAARPILASERRLELTGEAATAALGGALAQAARPGDVIALSGDLGSGKSTLARAFLRALGVAGDVPSPTFTLVQTYETAQGIVSHFDLYRLKRADEVYELGLEDALADGIALIEWPERAGGLLPRDRLEIALAMGGAADRRTAVLRGAGDWPERLDRLALGDDTGRG